MLTFLVGIAVVVVDVAVVVVVVVKIISVHQGPVFRVVLLICLTN